MKLRTAVLVVLAGFAAIPTCRLLKMKIDRARRMAEWRAREATKPRPEYWPIDEPWPAKDGPIMAIFETDPPFYVLRSGREVRGMRPGSYEALRATVARLYARETSSSTWVNLSSDQEKFMAAFESRRPARPKARR